MILVLYSLFSNLQTQHGLFEKLLVQIPVSIRSSIIRFKSADDRWARLMGKLLILNGLSQLEKNQYSLDAIEYNLFRRPFFPDTLIDFNISHSKGCVVLAIGAHCRLGIDVEKVRPIRIEDYFESMRTEEKASMYASDFKLRDFYQYWTEKESVIKANGKGLEIPLKEFIVVRKHTILEQVSWFLREITISDNYVCNLATDLYGKDLEIRMHQVSWDHEAKFRLE